MATIEEQLLSKILQISSADTADSITPTMVATPLDLLRQLAKELVAALQTQVAPFKGLTNDPDSLYALASYGIYYNTQYWKGLLAVVFDHNNVVSQVALSSSTPSYSGNTLSWVSGPCVMKRTYSNGSWGRWEIATGYEIVEGSTTYNDAKDGTIYKNGVKIYPKTVSDVVFDNETGHTVKQDLSALSQEIVSLRNVISTIYNALGAYSFPYGKPQNIFNVFSVNQTLSNVTSNYTSNLIENGYPLTILLTADTNYVLGNVVVIMGGVDITSTCYSNGVINIPSVTGNVEIFAAAAKSASSYIQNGLVFQMDGLEQGSNTSAWTDLVNGVVFTPNGATKRANGWYFDGVDDYMLGDSNMGSFNPNAHTVEVCIQSELSNQAYYVFVDSEGKTIFCYIYNYQSKDWYTIRGTQASGAYGGSLNTGTRDNGNGAKIVSINGAVTQGNDGGRVNGDTKTITNLSNGSATGYPTIGARYVASQSGFADFFKGTVHAIRIYNRALTLAEMLANQKIDNERFDLGLTIN